MFAAAAWLLFVTSLFFRAAKGETAAATVADATIGDSSDQFEYVGSRDSRDYMGKGRHHGAQIRPLEDWSLGQDPVCFKKSTDSQSNGDRNRRRDLPLRLESFTASPVPGSNHSTEKTP